MVKRGCNQSIHMYCEEYNSLGEREVLLCKKTLGGKEKMASVTSNTTIGTNQYAIVRSSNKAYIYLLINVLYAIGIDGL